MISSVHNPRIKDAARLKHKRERQSSGLTLIDGAREIAYALKAGIALTGVFRCPEFLNRPAAESVESQIKQHNIPVFDVSRPVFAKLSFGQRREGLVAVGRTPSCRWETVNHKSGLLVVVEKVEKPGNLGAILRSCDAAGIDAVLVADPLTDLFNPNVIRASIGTVFHVPTVVADGKEIRTYLKNNKIRLIAATPHAGKDYTAVSYAPPTAILVGNEDCGLSPGWLEQADIRVRIPMRGIADSLNVSVTAAVLLFEAVRQRRR